MSLQTQDSLFNIAYAILAIECFVYLLRIFKVSIRTPDGGNFRDLPRLFYLGMGLTAQLATLVIPLTFKGYIGSSVCLPATGLPFLVIYAAYNHIEKPKRKPIEEK